MPASAKAGYFFALGWSRLVKEARRTQGKGNEAG